MSNSKRKMKTVLIIAAGFAGLALLLGAVLHFQNRNTVQCPSEATIQPYDEDVLAGYRQSPAFFEVIQSKASSDQFDTVTLLKDYEAYQRFIRKYEDIRVTNFATKAGAEGKFKSGYIALALNIMSNEQISAPCDLIVLQRGEKEGRLAFLVQSAPLNLLYTYDGDVEDAESTLLITFVPKTAMENIIEVDVFLVQE